MNHRFDWHNAETKIWVTVDLSVVEIIPTENAHRRLGFR